MKRILSKFRTIALLIAACFMMGISHGQGGSTIWDGVYSAEQAARGATVYSETCIACHGQDLGGNSNAPGLVGMGFMFLWEGKTLGAFFEKIRDEMPTDKPGQLSAQAYLDVVAYIMQANSFPTGEHELARDVEALNEIVIATKR